MHKQQKHAAIQFSINLDDEIKRLPLRHSLSKDTN